MMSIDDWNTIPIPVAEENLELMRNGMPTTLPQLYVLPSRARAVHENFINRLEKARWGFLLVVGENRAGKSAYLRYLQNRAIQLGYCLIHFEINETQITQMGVAPYFNQQLLNNLRLWDGETFWYKLQTNESFRARIRQVIENDRADFDFYSPPLTSAIYAVVSGSGDRKSKLAHSFLRGEDLYVSELREIEIYDRTARSLLRLPTDKVIYFLKELVTRLEHQAMLITVDEIERVGILTPTKGRETLFMLRDLINILTSEDSQAAKRGILQGVFLCFAISTFFLGYSGVIEVEGVDFKARADREGRPKVQLGDVPRLANLLKHSASMINVELNIDDLKAIAERVLGCYQRAKQKTINLTAEQLAHEAYHNTGSMLAGPCIQEMIRILDSTKP
jgi:hypothetical protein